MNQTTKKKAVLIVSGLLGASVAVQASVSNTGNEASFDASTTIAYDSFFTDFGTGFGLYNTVSAHSFYRGGVTYDSAQNLT
jgi:hypothetical protein